VSALWIFTEADPANPPRLELDAGAIGRLLGARGIRFERWPTPERLAPSAPNEEILAAYHAEIERLRAEGPYPTVDVVRLARTPGDPEWPAKAKTAREKFLNEHSHDEHEVRFFVEGSGMFYLRIAGEVLAVLCERGDRISVPGGTLHWFDMGSDPAFCAIRFFGTPDGWVGRFTGDPIATRFPTFDELTRDLATAAP
jgi:1,2-dihydroxy-3-keto-5-methylthiopentene dioxygenase